MVALDLVSSAYLAVNETAAVLWPLVEAGTTEHEFVQELTARFGIDVDRARADVGVFVGQLRSMTLVEDG